MNNEVYARTMNMMFQRVDLALRNVVLEYHDGWYDEVIEIEQPR